MHVRSHDIKYGSYQKNDEREVYISLRTTTLRFLSKKNFGLHLYESRATFDAEIYLRVLLAVVIPHLFSVLSAQLKSPSLFFLSRERKSEWEGGRVLAASPSSDSKGERGLLYRASPSPSPADLMGWDPLKRTNAPGVVV